MGQADYYAEGLWNFRCSICKVEKPADAFTPRKGIKRGRVYACRDCRRYQSNKWSAANREKRREYVRAFRLRHLESEKERVRRYSKDNNAYMNFRNQYRYAMQRMAVPKWNETFIMKEAYLLASLRTKCTGVPWQVDHVVPIQSSLVCGLHVHNNLRVVEACENHSKGNRHWPEMP